MVCMTGNGLYYTKWMDSKTVHMLSNFLLGCPDQEISPKVKGAQTSKMVKCPNVLHHCNKFMGEVDLMGQKKVTYQFDHRSTHKYYLKLVFDLVDISVNNAFIIYEKLCSDLNVVPMELKYFRCAVIRGLAGSFSSRKRAIPAGVIHGSVKRQQLHGVSSVPHTMKKVEMRKRCKLCTQKKVQNCTNNVCVECNVPLCYANRRNCFATYHNQ